MKPETDFRTKRRRKRLESTFAHARKQTEAARRAEGPDEAGFHYYESGALSYDQTFYSLLDGEGKRVGLAEMVTERIKHGKQAIALDVMATTSFLNEVQPTAGLAVTLTDPRTVERQQAEANKGIELMTGDILDTKTWLAMKAWVQTHSPDQTFDFIFSRAVAGTESIPEDDRVFRLLLGRLYKVLSEDNGEMFLQTPLGSAEYIVENIRRKLDNVPGIQVKYQLPHPLTVEHPSAFPAIQKYPIIRLTRQSGSPKELPLI